MSFVLAVPDLVSTAATDLAGIGSTLRQANAAAATQTMEVLAAGEDEVSAAVAALFGSHAQAYQAVSAQAAAFHQQFVQALGAGAPAMPAPRRPTCRLCRPPCRICSASSTRPPRCCWAAR